MKIKRHNWSSSILDKRMPVTSYGHYGLPLLLFPAISDSHEEYEDTGLIKSISPYIESGKFKVFSISGNNSESWLNETKSPQEKSEAHYKYNSYVVEELIPRIFGECGSPVPIIAAGAGIGGYHAANTYFRRPDLIFGTVAISAFYNIEPLSKSYFDENCYFNSPVHYLPNLTDDYWLSFLLTKRHVFLLSGSGEGEHPHNIHHFTGILDSKGIPYFADVWGQEWGRSWDTWKEMFVHVLKNKL